MTDIIDPEQHSHLIELQRAANRAYAALDGHAPGVRGTELSDEQREEAVALRERASAAAVELREALFASGLVEKHGYYLPSQALKDAAREADSAGTEEPAGTEESADTEEEPATDETAQADEIERADAPA